MNDFVANNSFKVISVNPSQKTIGAINTDLLASVARHCRPADINIKSMRLKTLVNLFFGINKNVNEAFSGKLLFARCAVAVILICFAAMTGFATLSAWIAVAVATTLLLGFQTRIITSLAAITMIGISIVKFYPEISIINASDAEIFISRIAAGIPLSGIECLLTAAFFAALAIFGPGRFSADQILRRKAFSAIKRNSVKRARQHRNQLANQRMSYRAFAAE